MKIAITSDLHLEFRASQLPRLEEQVDVLILAGDINSAKNYEQTAIAVANGKADYIIGIAGNHEFYGTRHCKGLDVLRSSTALTFLENDSVIIDGVKFIGATLWTDLNFNGNKHLDALRLVDYMNDFRRIKMLDKGVYRSLSTSYMVDRHRESRSYIRDELEHWNGKSVVVTHHAPHGDSIDQDYVGHWANCGYVSHILDGFFPEPDVWVHGHMHAPVDYLAGKTRVISNPRGYPGEFGNYKYDFRILSV